MNVLFINPPDPGTFEPVLGLGIPYLAACTLKLDFVSSVKIIDAHVLRYSIEETVIEAGKYHPDIIGLTVLTSSFNVSLRLAKKLKQINSDSIIIFGGAHATALPETVLENECVDFVVRNEGEITFCELIKRIHFGESYSGLDGISYRKNGEIIHEEKRHRILDLDRLPFPARDLLPPLNKYHTYSMFPPQVLVSTPIIAARGCPFNCYFCSNKSVWGSLRSVERSPGNIVDEMEHIIDKYRINAFYVSTETITLSDETVVGLCNEIEKRKLKIHWITSSTVRGITLDMLKVMKSAGCCSINYGIETGSERLRERFPKFKGLTNKDIKGVFDLTKKMDIKPTASLLVGLPGESEETINESIRLVRDIKPWEFSFNIVVPFPGNDLWYEYVVPSKTNINWDDAVPVNHDDQSTPKIFFNCSGLSDDELIRLYRKARKETEFSFNMIPTNINRLLHSRGLGHALKKILHGIKIYFSK